MTDHLRHDVPSDVAELLEADRELTRKEMQTLKAAGEAAWSAALSQTAQRAHGTYAVADPQQFKECVNRHLSTPERAELLGADIFICPVCGTILKDRRTATATAVLLERRRLAQLLQAVEDLPEGAERRSAWERFRSALGLTPREDDQ